MAQDFPKINRSTVIEKVVHDAIGGEGRHWDLLYSGIEGVRPDVKVPPKSWEQLPKLSVSFGERLCSREAILEHQKPGWFATQIAMDLIWISGFTLVGSRIEHGPDLIRPYLRRCLERMETDTGSFDLAVLESHNKWCYCARVIADHDAPEPMLFTQAAESTLNIAALVLDLGVCPGFG